MNFALQKVKQEPLLTEKEEVLIGYSLKYRMLINFQKNHTKQPTQPQ